jgi:ABC-type antimicrobial peptide transport system permease subunit
MVEWQKYKTKLIRNIKVTGAYTVFLALLGLYFVKKIVLLLNKFKINSEPAAKKIDLLMDKIDGKNEGEVSRIYLIELAMRNLRSKKMRAVVTVGGMAVGVGAVVFLVSLGYGLEKLVISRVARLDELKMIDVGMGEVVTSRMNDNVIQKISGFEGVSDVIPAVSMVAKIKYKNSVVDMMSIGVDERYLKAVGAKIVTGIGLKDKPENKSVGEIPSQGTVAGWQQEMVTVAKGDKAEVGLMTFDLREGQMVPLWKECNKDSEMLGYITRQEGGYVGEKVWGERFYLGDDSGVVGRNVSSNEEYSVWVRTKASLWNQEDDGKAMMMLGDNSYQQWGTGCLMNKDLIFLGKLSGYDSLDKYLSGEAEKLIDGRVLGEATASAEATQSADKPVADLFETVVATDSAGVEWVEIKRTSAGDTAQKDLSFSESPTGEAFISLGMLRVFGLSKEKVIGEKFGVSFIIPDGLIPDKSGRLQSEQTDFMVAGVIDDETSNYFYFHLADARKLGVKNYSQLKVINKDQTTVAKVRKEIETSGFRTMSTLDTVAEIEKLFGTLRLVLGLLGTIALAVAALGMFNTMTVSLLERTREVGVMKAMGMLSDDVRELFLAESMIMGVGGGLCGVLVGVLGGKLVSLILTSVSVVKGQGAMDISYVPFFFLSFILLVSFAVGILTGWYPSRRARQISALNALRYE